MLLSSFLIWSLILKKKIVRPDDYKLQTQVTNVIFEKSFEIRVNPACSSCATSFARQVVQCTKSHSFTTSVIHFSGRQLTLKTIQADVLRKSSVYIYLTNFRISVKQITTTRENVQVDDNFKMFAQKKKCLLGLSMPYTISSVEESRTCPLSSTRNTMTDRLLKWEI